MLERAEFRCQSEERADEPELRGKNVYHQSKSKLLRKLETKFDFALHFTERIARRD